MHCAPCVVVISKTLVIIILSTLLRENTYVYIHSPTPTPTLEQFLRWKKRVWRKERETLLGKESYRDKCAVKVTEEPSCAISQVNSS